MEKHWPDVPRWRDIRTLTKESFYERTGRTTVDIISGGFPCQPFSVAGKQKGKGDDRYLWPEMLRVIRELAPSWVVGENVPGILRIAGKTVCEDLEREGYAVTVFNFEAADVGALHRRERVFFVANTESRKSRKQESRDGWEGIGRGSEKVIDVADAEHKRQISTESTSRHRAELSEDGSFRGQDIDRTRIKSERQFEPGLGMLADGLSYWLDGYWRVEPNIPRVATGVKNRVDRLKCLGNAVVPQQAYPIFKAIAEIERSAE